MAKKKTAKASTEKPAATKGAAGKAPAAPAEKRPIDSYTHGDKRRANNPPVGLVCTFGQLGILHGESE
jgi:hypothetical protein